MAKIGIKGPKISKKNTQKNNSKISSLRLYVVVIVISYIKLSLVSAISMMHFTALESNSHFSLVF